ncbi:35485_t:CDS:2, partial [Racocetra persica]
EELIKIRLENLSKELQTSGTTLTQINNILLAPMQRGRLGNTQLDQLLSLYLPKDDKVYQLEYRLKKPTGKGGFLIVDAIIFGIDGKNNIAIDSKFPLENFLLLHKENLSDLEKKEIEKNFKNNLKDHIKKVAEYVSELDGTDHAIMFIPSEAVFAKINEHGYYEIMEFALERKVSLFTKSNKTLEEFNISVQKLVKKGEGIRKRKAVPLSEKEKLEEKDQENLGE